MIIKNICKKFGNEEVLRDVTFSTMLDDKFALIGNNGCGKSTLLKIIAGKISADSGEIKLVNEKVSFLKQEVEYDDYNLSILEYVKKHIGLQLLQDKLQQLEKNLTDENYVEYDEYLTEFIDRDGYNIDANVKQLMSDFRLNKQLDDTIFSLSGGEKMKVLLITCLLSDGNVLLLDEPTNNLDLESIMSLQKYLSTIKNKTIILVSHDEEFISAVTQKVLVLEEGKLTVYPYNYSTYKTNQEKEYENKLTEYNTLIKKQQTLKTKIISLKESQNSAKSIKPKDNDKIGADYKQGRGENKSGALVKKYTKEMENLHVDNNFKHKEKFDFEIGEQTQKTASRNIIVKNCVCGYSGFKTQPISISIDFGQRILLQGNNGEGKTTFLKTLLGITPKLDGELIIGSGVKFGYVEQATLDDSELSMLEYLSEENEKIDKSTIFQVLTNFGLNYDDKDKKFKTFSAGQRTKINLAKLSLQKINTLILDEPTNHLDIEGANVIYSALQKFKGTIIAVSHNQTFIKNFNPDQVIKISKNSV